MKAFLLTAIFFAAVSTAAAQVEIDRLLERVNNTPIMTSDIRQARLLKLVPPPAKDDSEIQTAIENRILLLAEVARAGTAEPAAEMIARSRQTWRAQFPADTDIPRLLSRSGMTDKALEAWLRDDLRIAAYFDQRFGPAQDERRASRIAIFIGDLRRRANLIAKLPEVLHK